MDGKIRTDNAYPTGFTDAVSTERTNENVHSLYDVKVRFFVHRIKAEEAKYKLWHVYSVRTRQKNVPYMTTLDGRTIRYPDPLVKVNDTIMVDIGTSKVKDFIKFDSGDFVVITDGLNLDHHPQRETSWIFRHCSCALGHTTFATRLSYVLVIGKGSKPWISLPRGKGVKLSIAEERDRRISAKTQ